MRVAAIRSLYFLTLPRDICSAGPPAPPPAPPCSPPWLGIRHFILEKAHFSVQNSLSAERIIREGAVRCAGWPTRVRLRELYGHCFCENTYHKVYCIRATTASVALIMTELISGRDACASIRVNGFVFPTT